MKELLSVYFHIIILCHSWQILSHLSDQAFQPDIHSSFHVSSGSLAPSLMSAVHRDFLQASMSRAGGLLPRRRAVLLRKPNR